MAIIDKNRAKFYFGGYVLEAANPWIPGRPHARLVDILAAHYQSGRVLELCTGTGYVARKLAAVRPALDVFGIDISPEMLGIGRRHARRDALDNLTLTEADAGELPYPDGSFDAVFAAMGMHELPTDVRHRAVAETVRLLKPGGRFVAIDIDRPAGPTGFAVDAYFRVMEPPYARAIVGDGLVSLLEDGGLVVEHVESASTWTPTQLIVASKPDLHE